MSKRKIQAVAEPSEQTLRLLELSRGVADPDAPQVQQVASQLLMLPQAEQIAAVQWMASLPDYVGIVACLLGRIGVSGALRRALKRAVFDLRRRGVQVVIPAAPATEQESPSLSREWTVEEAYASVVYTSGTLGPAPLQLRFFMRHVSGKQSVFMLNISPDGHLQEALLTEEGVRDLYQECVDNPYRQRPHTTIERLDKEFVAVPIDWAVQVAYDIRQRNIQEHGPIPLHAAFYWGRLPEPPNPRVPMPIDSIPNAEAGWLVSPLVTAQSPPAFPPRMLSVATIYTPPTEVFVTMTQEVMEETKSPLVLTPQTQEERSKQMLTTLRKRLFDNNRYRDILQVMLPIYGSVFLLGGDRASALWCKAMWRETVERQDLPFWDTNVANILLLLRYEMLRHLTGTREEDIVNETPSLST
ncbi:MAG: hypothetical protein ACUVTY_04705 [Armatimonadota bacterium]